MHAEMLILRFSKEVVDEPIIYRLVKDYDLEFNLLKATIYPRKEGLIVMELKGHPKNFRQGIKYLKDAGVKVQRVAHAVRGLHRAVPHRGPGRGAPGDECDL
jgi:ABC-type methionine transport system ATPase subunit